jgi:hypothetical protein
MSFQAFLSHAVHMRESVEIAESARLVARPIVCPICWDHVLEQIDGIRFSARTVDEHDIS